MLDEWSFEYLSGLVNMRCKQVVSVRRVGLCIWEGRFCEYE